MVVIQCSAVGTLDAVVAVLAKKVYCTTPFGIGRAFKEALALWNMVAVISTVI